ncbi:hypothetical protein ACFSHT_10015 [Paraburkholderia silviterrae]|uniref:Uncharacterized protein n=1 Tax=Paraburkholderia silviterrae TaxID=2528715 RepID=A0A4R5MF94_9BURK|nr:hypothetical protein [Paraburkholderia silviterrae]TDG25297.1 hypothetical protein EYW47_05505 [Paraburkholderia silviterrae]
MPVVVSVAIIAVGFGAAATWLIATRLPAEWVERGRNDGRYAALSAADELVEVPETDPRRVQARTHSRRVRRARVRATHTRTAKPG